MSTPTRLLTYEEFIALPDDANRYELIDGELVVPPAPSFAHGRSVLQLIRLLDTYLLPRGLGRYLFTAPVDVRLAETIVVAPDIFVVNPHRGDAFASPPAISGPPDLIIEVLSPSTRIYDQTKKFEIYERAGVPEYWMVDQVTATISIFVLRDGRYVEHPNAGGRANSIVLPGFAVEVAEFFATVA